MAIVMVDGGTVSRDIKETYGFKTNYEKVREFQKAFDSPAPDQITRLDSDRIDLRWELIREEVLEVHDELHDEVGNTLPGDSVDIPALAKELADVLYVTYGMAVEYGIDLDAAFAEVHRSNMSKLGADGKPVINGENGVLDESRPIGKVLKGANYSPADIRTALGL